MLSTLSDQLLVGLIAGTVSLAVSLVSYFANQRQMRSQNERFEREIAAKRTDKLYEIRLRVYPRFFEIIATLFLCSIKPPERQDVHKKVLGEIQEWRKGEPMLVLSKASLSAILELEDALKKNPSNSRTGEFTQDQIDKIFRLRILSMGRMRQDIGLLHNSSEEYTFHGVKSKTIFKRQARILNN